MFRFGLMDSLKSLHSEKLLTLSSPNHNISRKKFYLMAIFLLLCLECVSGKAFPGTSKTEKFHQMKSCNNFSTGQPYLHLRFPFQSQSAMYKSNQFSDQIYLIGSFFLEPCTFGFEATNVIIKYTGSST